MVLETRVVTGSGGGPDKTILNSPRFLADAGYRVICAYMHPPDDPGFTALAEKAARWRAPLISVPDRGPLDAGVVSKLLDICRRERVRIWHGHDYKSNAIGLLLRPFWPMRLVTTVHGWVKETAKTPYYYAIDRLSLRAYERVLCVSQDLVDACRASGVPDHRCSVIDNAIDTTEFRRQCPIAEAKQKLGISSTRLAIGAVGRLSDEKGFDHLIRAVDQLVRSGHDIELLIVGEGDARRSLEDLIGALGLTGRVRLLGYRSDIADVYQAMDVFALSSLREGLPNVVLEAMAMEVPVVATRIAGVPSLVRHGESGLLVESGDVAGLANGLAMLLSNADLRATLARNGRKRVESDFSFDCRMQKIRNIYDELLGVRRLSRRSETAGSAVRS